MIYLSHSVLLSPTQHNFMHTLLLLTGGVFAGYVKWPPWTEFPGQALLTCSVFGSLPFASCVSFW